MNTIVNFEIALLLDKKNYGEHKLTEYYYEREDYFYKDELISKKGELFHNEDYPYNVYSGQLNAPTIADVVMWLYEKHGVWVEANFLPNVDKFAFIAKPLDFKKPKEFASYKEYYEATKQFVSTEKYNSPTEAYEAAITYSLENLL